MGSNFPLSQANTKFVFLDKYDEIALISDLFPQLKGFEGKKSISVWKQQSIKVGACQRMSGRWVCLASCLTSSQQALTGLQERSAREEGRMNNLIAVEAVRGAHKAKQQPS